MNSVDTNISALVGMTSLVPFHLRNDVNVNTFVMFTFTDCGFSHSQKISNWLEVGPKDNQNRLDSVASDTQIAQRVQERGVRPPECRRVPIHEHRPSETAIAGEAEFGRRHRRSRTAVGAFTDATSYDRHRRLLTGWVPFAFSSVRIRR
jgi:hypothetical protein